MSSLQFKSEELTELAYGGGYDHLEFIETVEGDDSRWSRSYTLIFKFDGKLWEAGYQRGLTEYQDNGIEWYNENGDLITCYEVEKIPVTTYEYRRKKDT